MFFVKIFAKRLKLASNSRQFFVFNMELAGGCAFIKTLAEGPTVNRVLPTPSPRAPVDG